MEMQKLVFTSLVRNSSIYFQRPHLNCSGELEECEEHTNRRLIVNETSKKLEPSNFKNRKIKIKSDNNNNKNWNLPIISKPKLSLLELNSESLIKRNGDISCSLFPIKLEKSILNNEALYF